MGIRKPLLGGLFCSAAMMAASAAWAQAPAPQGASGSSVQKLDEIVVTGSFIRRSVGFPSSSPVDTVTAQDMQVSAPTNLSNVFAELPYNFGSSFSTGRALGGGERGFGGINLRGLGQAATLALLNGHRQTQVADSPDNIVDINSLVPEILIQRTEILKDGASALYGTDAVAGVANIITRDRFDGLQVSIKDNQFSYSHKGDRTAQIMAGKAFMDGKLRVLGAIEYNQQDMMSSTFNAPILAGDRSNLRYTIASAVPGRYVVPTRNAAGQLATATKTIVDPSCGQVAGSVSTNVPPATAIASALPLSSATDCRYFFFDDNALQSGMEKWQGYVKGTYEFSGDLKLTVDAGYTNFSTSTPYTAGETISVPVTIPGYNPGNTFRAVNASGQPLYAVSSGVSAGYAVNGQTVFLPARDSAGKVILTANPTDPSSGIPFNEDVLYNGRLLGSQCGLPTNNSMPAGECAKANSSRSHNVVFNTSAYLNGRAMDRWDWSAGTTYSQYEITTNGTTFNGITNRFLPALKGLGGANCTGTTPNANGCSYFNPFGNSTFATGANAYQANSAALVNYVVPKLSDYYKSTLLVAEANVSGPVYKLPAGDLAVAVGYQFRHATLAANYDAQRNAANTLNLNTAQDFGVSRDTHAIFGEIRAPLLDSDSLGYLEASGAARYEKIGNSLSTSNPKLGLLYNSPHQWVSVRASYGTSFVAPSLFRLFGNVGAGAAVSDCPPSLNPVCTGQTNLRVTQVSMGNPNLKPQTSTAWSTGATFKPLEGLKVSVDWWDYRFKDLITAGNTSAQVLADPTGSKGLIVRNATGQLAQVIVQYINAAALKTNGFDFEVDYKRNLGDYGRAGLNLAGTRINQYDLTPTAGAAVVQGAGHTNDQPTVSGLGLQPNPLWRFNLAGTWQGGPHSFTAVLRYYGTLEDSRLAGTVIPDWYPVDLTYAYDMHPKWGHVQDLQLSVGATNVFNKTPPYIPFPAFQAFIPTLYDIRGQSVWGKIVATF